MKKKYVVIGGDWRESESIIGEFVSTIKKFGLYVYDLGGGTDTYIYVISNKKLSKVEIEDIAGG